MRLTVMFGAAMHPALSDAALRFSAANKSLEALGAEVPEMMNWWAGKLGPWFVWNMRSAKVYCSASWKYGCTSEGFTYINWGFAGAQFVVPVGHCTGIRSAPSILPPSYVSTNDLWL